MAPTLVRHSLRIHLNDFDRRSTHFNDHVNVLSRRGLSTTTINTIIIVCGSLLFIFLLGIALLVLRHHRKSRTSQPNLTTEIALAQSKSGSTTGGGAFVQDKRPQSFQPLPCPQRLTSFQKSLITPWSPFLSPRSSFMSSKKRNYPPPKPLFLFPPEARTSTDGNTDAPEKGTTEQKPPKRLSEYIHSPTIISPASETETKVKAEGKPKHKHKSRPSLSSWFRGRSSSDTSKRASSKSKTSPRVSATVTSSTTTTVAASLSSLSGQDEEKEKCENEETTGGDLTQVPEEDFVLQPPPAIALEEPRRGSTSSSLSVKPFAVSVHLKKDPHFSWTDPLRMSTDSLVNEDMQSKLRRKLSRRNKAKQAADSKNANDDNKENDTEQRNKQSPGLGISLDENEVMPTDAATMEVPSSPSSPSPQPGLRRSQTDFEKQTAEQESRSSSLLRTKSIPVISSPLRSSMTVEPSSSRSSTPTSPSPLRNSSTLSARELQEDSESEEQELEERPQSQTSSQLSLAPDDKKVTPRRPRTSSPPSLARVQEQPAAESEATAFEYPRQPPPVPPKDPHLRPRQPTQSRRSQQQQRRSGRSGMKTITQVPAGYIPMYRHAYSHSYTSLTAPALVKTSLSKTASSTPSSRAASPFLESEKVAEVDAARGRERSRTEASKSQVSMTPGGVVTIPKTPKTPLRMRPGDQRVTWSMI